MRKFILFSLICLFSVITLKAQEQELNNGYMRFGFNTEVSKVMDDYRITNNCLNVQVGVFVSKRSAFEIDFKYGFEKDDISHFALGFNYRLHCDLLYFKLGAGFKEFRVDYNEIDYDEKFSGCNVKMGFGLSLPLTKTTYVDMGVDFSRFFNEDWYGDCNFFEAVVFEPTIGLRFKF